ncbi:MAG: UDP-N-acetylmuramoyl-L-alanyl-D-glutamate--2,6-diaminopimelate ligase [Pseudomonadota bacterium]
MPTLATLGLGDLPHEGPAPDMEATITGLCVDSRETKPGYLFAALKGTTLDGAEFAQYAVRMGAGAVLCSAEGAETAARDIGPLPIPFLISDNPRHDLALAASRFYPGQPDVMVAITGTNGKTSVASFARQLFVALGHRAANFGTVGVEGAVSKPLTMTTPEPITLHRLLDELQGEGVTHAAMEASSHGLAQARLDGVRLRAGAFTNFSRDHLEYHATVDDYLDAKLRLFRDLLPRNAVAVLNADDATYGKTWAAARDAGLEVIPLGRDAAASTGLRLIDARFDKRGQELLMQWHGKDVTTRLDLIGGFQGLNAMTAAALVIGTGEAPNEVFAAMAKLTGVRGRMEHVATRANGAAIYVDYSHTPDGLATALAALRLHTEGRLLVVFGAGGDRDPGKRPMMGHAACEGADGVIVTDDNPRTEDPALIRKAVMAACPTSIEIGDRAEAILTGVDALSPQDCLLIAGKGHETGQIVGTDVIPFDDAEQARAAVVALDGEGFGGTETQ